MYFKVKSSKIVFDIIIRDIILNFNEYHFFFSGIHIFTFVINFSPAGVIRAL